MPCVVLNDRMQRHGRMMSSVPLTLLLGCWLAADFHAVPQNHPDKNVTVNYRGFEALVCANASCRGRCGDPDATYCACDEHCMILGICCIDYQAECITNTSFADSNITQEFLERYEIQQASRCGHPGPAAMVPNRISLIERCPLSPYVNNQELCENITYEQPTVSKMLAVYSNSSGLVFKNEYCAICHGVMDWIPITMYVDTVDSKRNNMLYIAKTQGTDGILDLIKKEYQSFKADGYKISVRFDVSALPVSFVRLTCSTARSLNDHYDCKHSNPDLAREFQDSYRSPVNYIMIRSRKIYDNWHEIQYDCESFDRISDTYDISCSEYYIKKHVSHLWSHSLAISHSGVSYVKKHVFCVIGQIADMMSNECVVLPCRIRSRLVAGACHSVSKDVLISPTPRTPDQLHVVLVLSHSQSLASLVVPIKRYVIYPVDIEWDAISCSPFTDELNAYCATVRLGYSVNTLFYTMSHKDSRETFFNIIRSSLVNVSLIALLNYDPMAELACPKGALEHHDNASMLTSTVFGNLQGASNNAVQIVIPKPSITYSVDWVAVKLMWSVTESDQTVEYNAHQVSVAVCSDDTSLATCNTALLLSHEYTAKVTGKTTTLSLTNSTRSFPISSNDIIITNNKSLILCKSTLVQALKVDAKKKSSSGNANIKAANLGPIAMSLLMTVFIIN